MARVCERAAIKACVSDEYGRCGDGDEENAGTAANGDVCINFFFFFLFLQPSHMRQYFYFWYFDIFILHFGCANKRSKPDWEKLDMSAANARDSMEWNALSFCIVAVGLRSTFHVATHAHGKCSRMLMCVDILWFIFLHIYSGCSTCKWLIRFNINASKERIVKVNSYQ